MTESVQALVAEDEALIAALIESTLADEGYEVTVVESGSDAMAALSCSGSFGLLVTDIRMEPGPNGWTVAMHARELQPSIAVIYITGDSMAEWRLYGVPDSVLVEKPFFAQQLAAAVACVL